MNAFPTLVLDNGASTVKTNVITKDGMPEPRIISNAIVRQTKGKKRTFFGHELENCDDFSSLHFRLPFERGYLTDWDAQKAIWDGILSKNALKVNPPDYSLLITEPYFNLPNIQEQYDQFVFEEYEFQSYFRCAPASLIPYGSLFKTDDTTPPECILVVDSGFSFTHVVPLMNGNVIWKSVRRLDVGGKLLTNHLKELLSYRQYDMMGETYVTNDIKEKCCYVSADHRRDMELCRSDPGQIVQEYILPRFSEHRQGRVKAHDEILADEDDVVRMCNERFSVPEVLFRPTDIGLMQPGLSSLISHSISSLPEDLQGLFWANIGLVGGNIKFPGFQQRLLTELRSLAPVDYEVCIYESPEPIAETYISGASFAQSSTFCKAVVTRSEYQEYGGNICRRKFFNVASHYRDPEPVNLEEKGREREKLKARGKSRAKNIDEESGSGKKSGRVSRTWSTSNK